jgi:O-methyltransferase involved in polyketide biosynthesis
VIEVNTHTMRALGVAPAVNRRAVGIDWCAPWPMALRQLGVDATRPKPADAAVSNAYVNATRT